jgi:hypothetical protein
MQMARLSELARSAEKFTIDNSPLILTAFGTAGVITTGYLAVKSGFKASKILEEAEYARNLHGDRIVGTRIKLSKKEKAKLTWMCYIPPATTAVLTCGAVIGANHIGTKRAAALAAAYSISEKAFDEYREVIKERLGEKKEREAHDDMQQHRMNNNPLGNREIVIMSGKTIAFDGYSGRYFESSMEDIKFAINKINHQINTRDYASLTDLYNELGLAPTQESDDVGWNVDKLLDIHITTTLTDKGEPALSLDYRVVPVRNFFRLQ